MELNFELQLSQKDYTQFNLFFARSLVWKYVLLVLFTYILLIIKNISIDIYIIIITLLFPLIFLIILIIQAKNTYKTNKLLHLKNSFKINDQGIFTISDAGNLNITFDKIFKLLESKYCIYIFTAKNAALIIPKYIFENSEDEITLRTILKNNLDPKKYKLKK